MIFHWIFFFFFFALHCECYKFFDNFVIELSESLNVFDTSMHFRNKLKKMGDI